MSAPTRRSMIAGLADTILTPSLRVGAMPVARSSGRWDFDAGAPYGQPIELAI